MVIGTIHTVCFSGPRPHKLYGYNRQLYGPLYNQLVGLVRNLYDMGYRKFISGGAQGFDQLCFWAVDTVRKEHPDIENVVYIPYKGQESKWRIDDIFGQNEYRAMLQAATAVHSITPDGKPASIAALFQRNEAMVNDSDLLLCLYPDQPFRNTKGGTAHAISYACDKTSINVYQLVLDVNKPAPYEMRCLQQSVFH